MENKIDGKPGSEWHLNKARSSIQEIFERPSYITKWKRQIRVKDPNYKPTFEPIPRARGIKEWSQLEDVWGLIKYASCYCDKPINQCIDGIKSPFGGYIKAGMDYYKNEHSPEWERWGYTVDKDKGKITIGTGTAPIGPTRVAIEFLTHCASSDHGIGGIPDFVRWGKAKPVEVIPIHEEEEPEFEAPWTFEDAQAWANQICAIEGAGNPTLCEDTVSKKVHNETIKWEFPHNCYWSDRWQRCNAHSLKRFTT